MIYHTTDFHLDHSNVIEFDGRPDKDIDTMNKRIIQTTNEYVGEDDWLVYHGDLLLNKHIDHDDIPAYNERVQYFLSQLRCKNIIYISGNHDRTWIRRQGIHRPNWALWNLFRIWECINCNEVFDPFRRFGLPKKCKKGCEWVAGNPLPIYNFHPMGYELRLTRRICAEQQIPIEFDGMLIVCTHYAHRVWNKSHKSKEGSPIGKSIALFGHSHGGLPGIRNSFDVGFNIWNRPLSLVEILTDLMPKHNATQPEYIPHHDQ